MTTPQFPGAKPSGPPSDERTRNIRPPSSPDRPPAVVRPGRQAHVRPGPATETVRLEKPSPDALPRSPDTIADRPTDTLSSPARLREQTLAFDAPAGSSPGSAASRGPYPNLAAPAPSDGSSTRGAGPAPTRSRRWPWVVLILLPILVIAISGVLLFLLLGG